MMNTATSPSRRNPHCRLWWITVVGGIAVCALRPFLEIFCIAKDTRILRPAGADSCRSTGGRVPELCPRCTLIVKPVRCQHLLLHVEARVSLVVADRSQDLLQHDK